MSKIAILGIGDDGLAAAPASVQQRVAEAEVVFGAPKALELLSSDITAERVELHAELAEQKSQLEAIGGRRAVVLVFGDPMFYGLARYFCQSLGKERFEIIPHVSSMQLAFARVMESWDDAYLTNLATHSLSAVVEKIRTADKVGLFTTDQVSPDRVAQALLDQRIDYFDAYVCENLGARTERVTRGSLGDIASQSFESPNVMILVRDRHAPDRARDAAGRRLFGNPDEAFLQSQPKYGLLTSSEVRSLALAQLDIGRKSIVWDVGAGSGSVSIEAAQLASDGRVFAIEMDPEDHDLIRSNAERFSTINVEPVLGKAPEAWTDLPDPDCIFIAGGGREVRSIAESAFERLRPGGRLVVHLVSLDNLAELRDAMRGRSELVNTWMINIARGTDQLDRLTFEALKPSFLLAAVK